MPKPIDVVYASGAEMITLPGGESVPLLFGTHWPASDPVVRARPDLFSPDPRFGLAYTPGHPPSGYDENLNELPAADDDGEEMEAATAAPGERRSVRRRRVDESHVEF